MANEYVDRQWMRLELRKARAEAAKVGAQSRPSDEPPLCSFCGAGSNNVETMIAGPSVYICGECISECQRLVDAGKRSKGEEDI